MRVFAFGLFLMVCSIVSLSLCCGYWASRGEKIFSPVSDVTLAHVATFYLGLLVLLTTQTATVTAFIVLVLLCTGVALLVTAALAFVAWAFFAALNVIGYRVAHFVGRTEGPDVFR